MDKLIEGQVSNKDIAEWMGVKPNTFNKNKDKYLGILNNFAEYHMDSRGHIIIDKVLNAVYSKAGSQQYELIKKEIDNTWSSTGLDTCKNVSKKIAKKLDGELTLASSTVYDYTRKGRNELYGIPFKQSGSLGQCIYLLCKETENGYVELSEEEIKIKNRLIKKYFGDATDKQILVASMVESGEISKEEAWDVLAEWTGMKGKNYLDFLTELQLTLQCKIIRGTLVERDALKALPEADFAFE